MTTRSLGLIGFLTCLFLILIALYFQHVEGLDPCPLCIFQRVAFIAAGLVFLLMALHNPRGFGRRVYGIGALICTITGVGIAARHVWLQNLPADQVPECGPGLDFMLETLPLTRLLETVFKGSGECAEVLWRFLGLSMPGWSLVWLVILTLFSFYVLLGRNPN